jgi:lipoyl(octanoyl) transferase
MQQSTQRGDFFTDLNDMQVKHSVKFENLGTGDYKKVWEYQEELFNNLLDKKLQRMGIPAENQEKVIHSLLFVEHPHVYTLGKSGSDNNLLIDHIQLQARDATFYRIDRGGDITYHGPGQIVGYPIFDLEDFGITLKQYIFMLEEAVIRTIAEFGIEGERLDGATGVWIDTATGGLTRKICAIGVRASRYVTMHGFAFNVNTDLDYFNYINPCGFIDKGVTSLQKEKGESLDPDLVRGVLKGKLEDVFSIEWVKE